MHGKQTPVDAEQEDNGSDEDEIHIGIFDSSFNPPTLAHLEIASTSFPAGHRTAASEEAANSATTSSSSETSKPDDRIKETSARGVRRTARRGGYTAKLLLLSARNVDKPPTHPGSDDHASSSNHSYQDDQKRAAEREEQEKKVRENATGVERVEMMILQARRMVTLSQGVRSREEGENVQQEQEACGNEDANGNIAVAVLNFPTFVGKSRIVHNWLAENLPRLLRHSKSDSSSIATRMPRVRLTFLIGSDTLTRLFRPAYYPASSSFPEIGPDMHTQLEHFFSLTRGDASRIVCVRRYLTSKEREEEEEFVRGDEGCRRWVREGGIRFVEEEKDGSGRRERGGVKKGEEMGLISSTNVRQRVKQVRQQQADRRAEDARAGAGEGGEGSIEQATVEALHDLCIDEVSRYIARKGLYRSS